MDSLSGNTSQPCLGSVVEALRGSERDTGLDPEAIRRISFYWDVVWHLTVRMRPFRLVMAPNLRFVGVIFRGKRLSVRR
jgi:pyruvate/oxaloacetate carboxyltransferase